MRLPLRATLFVSVLALVAAASLSYSLVHTPHLSSETLSVFFIFAILAVAAEIYATWVPAYKWQISSAIAICLAGLFILGPELAVVLVFLSTLVSELLLRWGSKKGEWVTSIVPITFNVSQLVVTIALAGILLRVFGRSTLLLGNPEEFALAIAAFLTYFVVNITFVMAIISLSEGGSFLYLLFRGIRQFFVQYLVLCASALLLTVLYSISLGHMFLALFPLTLVHISFQGYIKLQTEARKTFEKISELLDARDHYTAVHSTEVADLAVRIGRELSLPPSEIERLEIAAKVHDIGKVAVPDSILLKPGPLSDEEWRVMKTHPEISAELIEGLEIYSAVVDAVRHEHERWDGSGYPDGLKGDEIPFLARVIAAADIYNALTTDRPYRKRFSDEEAIRIIRRISGKDIDPDVAAALLRVIEKKVKGEGT